MTIANNRNSPGFSWRCQKIIGLPSNLTSCAKTLRIPIVFYYHDQSPEGFLADDDSIDCLATTAIHKKRFSKDKFKVFHPGGSIGNSLLLAKDIMVSGKKMPIINYNKNQYWKRIG